MTFEIFACLIFSLCDYDLSIFMWLWVEHFYYNWTFTNFGHICLEHKLFFSKHRHALKIAIFMMIIDYNHQLSRTAKGKITKKSTIRVSDDPLGQTHSLANCEYCCRLKSVLLLVDFEKCGRTDNMCENNDYYRPCLRVGWVDQKLAPRVSDDESLETETAWSVVCCTSNVKWVSFLGHVLTGLRHQNIL